jgi:hypothetical protein
LNQVEIFSQAVSKGAKLIPVPFYLDCVSAGFPSPADDYIEAELDLNRYMIRNPSGVKSPRDSWGRSSLYCLNKLTTEDGLIAWLYCLGMGPGSRGSS